MAGSMIYGFCILIAYTVMVQLAPQPFGAVAFFLFFAVQLARSARICWRRTRLPFATAGMAVAAAGSLMIALLAAAGQPFPRLPSGAWLALGPTLAAPAICFLVESRVNRGRWQHWAEYMRPKSAWDILLGRHIPPMRNGA